MTTTTTMRIRYTINDGNLVGNCEDLSADEVAARARQYRDLLDEAFRAEFGADTDIQIQIQYRTFGASAPPQIYSDDPDSDCLTLEERAAEIVRETFERLIEDATTLTTADRRTISRYVRAYYKSRNPRAIRFEADGSVTVYLDRMPNTDQPGRIFAGWDLDLLNDAHARA